MTLSLIHLRRGYQHMDNTTGRPNLNVSLDDLIKANRKPRNSDRRERDSTRPERRGRNSYRVERSPRRHHNRRRSPPPHLHRRSSGIKLVVSNLHYDVSRDDLKALFEEIGPVLRVYMHYDRAGRSNGVAEVTFARMEDARVAQERYHNMPLDGYPMQIETQTAPLRSEYDMALD